MLLELPERANSCLKTDIYLAISGDDQSHQNRMGVYQLTLNYGYYWVIRPALPNTLPKLLAVGALIKPSPWLQLQASRAPFYIAVGWKESKFATRQEQDSLQTGRNVKS